MTVLPSLIRLIRGLEYEDLQTIYSLAECPIMVPAPKVFEEFGLQPPDAQSLIMDSLFHLVNWFREIVSCFSRMIKQPIGKKVRIQSSYLYFLNPCQVTWVINYTRKYTRIKAFH